MKSIIALWLFAIAQIESHSSFGSGFAIKVEEDFVSPMIYQKTRRKTAELRLNCHRMSLSMAHVCVRIFNTTQAIETLCTR